jgi:hypothetical protein
MKVTSPLANLDVGIGAARREGNDLVLTSREGDAVQTVITVSAREVLHTIGTVLSSRSGLGFVLGLPFFWVRQSFGRGRASASVAQRRPNGDINKPW